MVWTIEDTGNIAETLVCLTEPTYLCLAAQTALTPGTLMITEYAALYLFIGDYLCEAPAVGAELLSDQSRSDPTTRLMDLRPNHRQGEQA